MKEVEDEHQKQKEAGPEKWNTNTCCVMICSSIIQCGKLDLFLCMQYDSFKILVVSIFLVLLAELPHLTS